MKIVAFRFAGTAREFLQYKISLFSNKWLHEVISRVYNVYIVYIHYTIIYKSIFNKQNAVTTLFVLYRGYSFTEGIHVITRLIQPIHDIISKVFSKK